MASRPYGALAVLPRIHVFGLTIYSFAIVFAAAGIVAGLIIARRLKEWDRPSEWGAEMAFAGMVGGAIGARVYYLAKNFNLVRHHFLAGVFSGSGFVWYGGVVGGAVGVGVWAYWRGLLGLKLFDLSAVPAAAGYAILRIGCQLSGDGDYGLPSHLPWAMSYRHGTVPTPPGVRVQPTPIYETISMGIVAWFLWRVRDRLRPGGLFACYLVLSGLERLLVEFVRRNPRVWAGLTVSQLVSIASMLAGAIWLATLARTRGLKAPTPSGPQLAQV